MGVPSLLAASMAARTAARLSAVRPVTPRASSWAWVGAVLVPGERAPMVVTRAMVRQMKPRAVIIDLSIDEGGCVETSRPTTHDQPTFVEEGVVHYCVPNVPGIVARTATHAFLNAAWPYIQLLANRGVAAALEADPALRRGLVTHHGQLMTKA